MRNPSQSWATALLFLSRCGQKHRPGVLLEFLERPWRTCWTGHGRTPPASHGPVRPSLAIPMLVILSMSPNAASVPSTSARRSPGFCYSLQYRRVLPPLPKAIVSPTPVLRASQHGDNSKSFRNQLITNVAETKQTLKNIFNHSRCSWGFGMSSCLSQCFAISNDMLSSPELGLMWSGDSLFQRQRPTPTIQSSNTRARGKKRRR